MLKDSHRKVIESATVTLAQEGGKGILVPGGLIITAAHCIDFKCDGGMVLGDHYVEDIKTIHGTIKGAPWSVEPLSDIAVVGSLDDQSFPDDAITYSNICMKLKPVPLCQDEFEDSGSFPVWIYTHTGIWLNGTAKQCFVDSHMLWVETKEQIEGGTSGSPIVNDSGELVGIVSNSSIIIQAGPCIGHHPRPHLTLPPWVLRIILDGD